MREGWVSHVDHVNKNETSLMMHYRSDLVDMLQLSKSRDDWPLGVSGDDPRDASAEYGREFMEASLALMVKAFEDGGV
jgi:creatinine amidohydrolase/Fe(II)-dependent formamide hydrolase-like protein